MAYRDNVDELCAKLGIHNPINERDVEVEEVLFFFDGPPALSVPRTDMNKAGRLFMQCESEGHLFANRAKIVPLTEVLKARAAEFFTPELWDDCTREKRTLVYGIRHGKEAEVIFK